MMKVFRLVFSIIVLIGIVGVLGIACLFIFIHPNKLKPILIAEVMQKTGYQLIIDGNMSWTFYPRIGIKTQHMQIKNPAEKIAFLDLHDVSIATDLTQLFNNNKKLHGDVYIKQFKYMNTNGQNAYVGLHWQNSILTMKPINISMYDGIMEGSAHGRNFLSLPSWDWDIQFKQIQLRTLLNDLYGEQNHLKITGLGQIQMQGKTIGINRSQIYANLNGLMNFSLRDGVIDGIDFNYFVQSADALLNRQSLENLKNTNRTPFDNLIGSAVIKNGVAETNNLFLVSSSFSTKINGQINLNNQNINLQLQILPLHAARIQWIIPLIIAGDLYRPTVQLDMLKLQAMITQEQLERVKVKVQDKVKKLPQQVDRFLKKLIDD